MLRSIPVTLGQGAFDTLRRNRRIQLPICSLVVILR
jgi:hypothetical protein